MAIKNELEKLNIKETFYSDDKYFSVEVARGQEVYDFIRTCIKEYYATSGECGGGFELYHFADNENLLLHFGNDSVGIYYGKLRQAI